jgi:hypothetical protein
LSASAAQAGSASLERLGMDSRIENATAGRPGSVEYAPGPIDRGT